MITIKQTNYLADHYNLYNSEPRLKRFYTFVDKVLSSPKVANLGGLLGVVASIIGTAKLFGWF